MAALTFYVIRATKDFPGYGAGKIGSDGNVYSFKKGWYAAREFVKPFDKAKIFTSHGAASKYLKTSSSLGGPSFSVGNCNREDYFEIVPIEISEPA